MNAEKIWPSDKILSLSLYKEIIKSDTTSLSGLRAAFFLAHNYDYNFVSPDSARKFYEWIIKHHDGSEQAQASQKRLVAISMFKKNISPNFGATVYFGNFLQKKSLTYFPL